MDDSVEAVPGLRVTSLNSKSLSVKTGIQLEDFPHEMLQISLKRRARPTNELLYCKLSVFFFFFLFFNAWWGLTSHSHRHSVSVIS